MWNPKTFFFIFILEHFSLGCFKWRKIIEQFRVARGEPICMNNCGCTKFLWQHIKNYGFGGWNFFKTNFTIYGFIKIILDYFLALNEISSTTLHYYQKIRFVKYVFLVFFKGPNFLLHWRQISVKKCTKVLNLAGTLLE